MLAGIDWIVAAPLLRASNPSTRIDVAELSKRIVLSRDLLGDSSCRLRNVDRNV